MSSHPPFGYRAVPDPVTGRGVVLDVDPAQAACIRAMFGLLVRDRIPITQAAAALNTAGHRSASGAKWTQQTLSRWARGHGPLTASGVWSWNDITVAIPPILTPAELTGYARQHLAGYKVPRSIDIHDELPRNEAGKLQKRALRDRYWQDTGRSI